MKTKLSARFLMLAAVFVFAAVSAGAQELQLHGRVSYDTKGMLVKGADDKDWDRATLNTLLMPGDALWVDQGGLSEVELAGGSFLRLADGSKAELKSLPPAADVRSWLGSFYVQRTSRSQGSFVVTTPSCQVDVPVDSCVRVDVDEKGAATVSVRWGGAEVRTEAGAPVRLTDAQRLWVDPGYLPSDPIGFDRGESDSFDQWNNERATVLANGYKTLPKGVEIAPPVVGVSDLGTYGEWVYVDSRPYWRPTVVVDYVPYRYGCWNYSPALGSVWVGAYPFCYVTSHYGRWSHFDRYGWVWGYDPVWSPAWATTVCAGDYLMWSPMGWDSRPVMVTQSAYFGLGGVNFCVSSTSWMPMSYVTTGWAPISACTPMFADTICTLPRDRINVWNIYVDNGHHGHGQGHGHGPHPTPYDTNVFNVRDYNPPRSIRGIAAPHDGPAPGERAHMLEARVGREHFAPVERTGSRMERSAAGRGAAMRSVRLENAPALQPDTAPGLMEMRHGRTTGSAGPNPEARREPGARELRTGRDGIPTISGDGRTAVRGETRTLRGTPAEPFTRGGVSARGTLRDIDPGTPAPGGASRFPSGPEKTPVRGSVRTAPGSSAMPSAGPRGDSGAESRRSSRISDLPTFPSSRGSRPLSFDTDASRTTAPRTASPRVESTPNIESRQPRFERSNPVQPRFEAPQSRIESPQPRFERSAPVQQPRIETPQPRFERSNPVQPRMEVPQSRIETPQPRFERSNPVQPRMEVPQSRIETPQPRFERSAPVQQPRIETPQPRFERSAPVQQPRFESPRISAPSATPRSFSSDSNSFSGRSSHTRGEGRGR